MVPRARMSRGAGRSSNMWAGRLAGRGLPPDAPDLSAWLDSESEDRERLWRGARHGRHECRSGEAGIEQLAGGGRRGRQRSQWRCRNDHAGLRRRPTGAARRSVCTRRSRVPIAPVCIGTMVDTVGGAMLLRRLSRDAGSRRTVGTAMERARTRECQQRTNDQRMNDARSGARQWARTHAHDDAVRLARGQGWHVKCVRVVTR